MLLISYMIQHYFGVPYQMFTEKVMTAYALLKAVDNAEEKDIERIRWIQENTHEDLHVSIWKLDRVINPSKGEFKNIVRKMSFIKTGAEDEDIEQGRGMIELTEDKIQHYLCEAINEVHCIVTKNIRGYKEEIKFEGFGDEKSEEMNFSSFGSLGGKK
jgi:hypothetical protein